MYCHEVIEKRSSLTKLQEEHKELQNLQRETENNLRITTGTLNDYRDNFLKNKWQEKIQKLTEEKYRNESQIESLNEQIEELNLKISKVQGDLVKNQKYIEQVDPSSIHNITRKLTGTDRWRHIECQTSPIETDSKSIMVESKGHNRSVKRRNRAKLRRFDRIKKSSQSGSMTGFGDSSEGFEISQTRKKKFGMLGILKTKNFAKNFKKKFKNKKIAEEQEHLKKLALYKKAQKEEDLGDINVSQEGSHDAKDIFDCILDPINVEETKADKTTLEVQRDKYRGSFILKPNNLIIIINN